MYRYSVFGGVLASPLEFPELPRTTRAPSWTIQVASGSYVASNAKPLGVDRVYGDVQVKAWRTDDGHLLSYDDTGQFHVRNGGDITWYPTSGRDVHIDEAARGDVLGRVLSLAMHQQDVLTLHAGAVAINGNGVAFLAPKGHGKSSLTAMLVRQGAKLLSDDTVPVSCRPPVTLLPGIPQLRLFRDAANAFEQSAMPDESSRKVLFNHLSPESVETTGVPFAAAYVLVPVQPSANRPAATRSRVGHIEGALAMVEHAKLGALLTGEDAARVLKAAGIAASSVPVYLLAMVREMDRLPEAASIVTRWHEEQG